MSCATPFHAHCPHNTYTLRRIPRPVYRLLFRSILTWADRQRQHRPCGRVVTSLTACLQAVDDANMTPLVVAIAFGSAACVRLLVDAGAPVDVMACAPLDTARPSQAAAPAPVPLLAMTGLQSNDDDAGRAKGQTGPWTVTVPRPNRGRSLFSLLMPFFTAVLNHRPS